MHDPIPYDPQPAKESAWQRLMIRLGLARRNKTDDRQQAAADRNAVWHAAEADRMTRQPGVSADAVAKAQRVFARVGSGK